jgi:hypothetical protein
VKRVAIKYFIILGIIIIIIIITITIIIIITGNKTSLVCQKCVFSYNTKR